MFSPAWSLTPLDPGSLPSPSTANSSKLIRSWGYNDDAAVYRGIVFSGQRKTMMAAEALGGGFNHHTRQLSLENILDGLSEVLRARFGQRLVEPVCFSLTGCAAPAAARTPDNRYANSQLVTHRSPPV